MKAIIQGFVLIASLTGMLYASTAWACTEVRVSAENGASVIGRSMEFGVDVNSELIIQPRGQQRSSTTPDGGKGVSWTSKYGVAYMNGFGLDIAADGMNEKGLSFGALYLPDYAKYNKEIPRGSEGKALGHMDIGLWILGNFATVDEVRKALDSVVVWGQGLKAYNNFILPLHYSVYDRSGKGMVFEFTDAGLKMYDNDLGVLTNSPTYDMTGT